MRLGDLMGNGVTTAIPEEGRAVDILGLTSDSREVRPGYLFAALPGAKLDGSRFIADAVGRGAIAILAPPGARLDAPGTNVQLVTDENPRRQFALMAARFFHAQPRTLAAVTGTNGKTSVADFTRQIWTALGHKAASLGTLGTIGPDGQEPGALTTPDPVALHRRLDDLARSGVDHAIMEASSHGLAQYRLDGARLSVAAFTNLGRDHLDYHETLERYFDAKTRLFTEILVADGTAVLNADDEHFATLAGACRDRGQRILSYGAAGTDIRLLAAEPTVAGQALEVSVFGKTHAVTLPLIGGFQAANALCALGIILADGTDPDAAVTALADLAGVPGRVQKVAVHSSGAAVYVDYAHTPDALENVLTAMRPHVGSGGRLIAVFGCGGDRDAGKRAPMGEVVRRLADLAIVTDDNPRTEDAASIRAETLRGCPDAREIGDRAEAIREALRDLRAGDIVVVAGKGHEQGQIVGDKVLPFDDAEVAARLMAEVDR